MEKPEKRQRMMTLIVIVNAIVAIAILFTVRSTLSSADVLSTAQNVDNIRTMADSSADKVAIAVKMYETQVAGTAYYINHHDTVMTADEVYEYLSTYYDTEIFNWQVVDSVQVMPTGYASVGFQAARCTSHGIETDIYGMYGYMDLMAIFGKAAEERVGQILCTKEFGDVFTLDKSFAITTAIRIAENGETGYKTLMLVVTSAEANSITENRYTSEGWAGLAYSNVIVDKSGDYVISNENFQGTNFIKTIELYNDDFTADDQEALLQQLAAGEAVESFYYENIRGERSLYTLSPVGEADWYILALVPVSTFRERGADAEGKIIFVLLTALFIIDVLYFVSVNKRLSVSLDNTQKAVEEAVRANQSKSSFLSRMSHEIRTPLNAIIGYNTIARNEIAAASTDAQRKQAEMKTMDCLEKSQVASKHLLTVINDVLDMSAIESGKAKIVKERFDFKGLITSLTTVFYSQARAKGIELEVIFGQLTGEWFVGDQMRTNQILTNLLSNAIKFTPTGGQVTMRISQTEADEQVAHIHFEVADTGIGMTEEYMTHLWTPFEQADSSISRRFGGTGLGMTITKNLVDMMGGSIHVSSQVGVGSTFEVDLVFEQAEPVESRQTYDFSDVSVLVVDDDAGTCEYIRQLFSRCDVKCATVTSGEDAIHAVSEAMRSGSPYSMCLVDWKMPQMDGIETVQRLREIAGSEMPIIVLSAYDFTEIADRAVEAGISKFVSKPLFQSSLFDLLVNNCRDHVPAESPAEKKVIFSGQRVLLAEDNAMNMEIARTLLTKAGLVVDSAWNGKEAVERFENADSGTYQAILMDVHMPEMNGLDATRAIRMLERPEAKTVPIIAMTADAFAENVAEALNAGMNDHIAKPIDLKNLFETLEKYIR